MPGKGAALGVIILVFVLIGATTTQAYTYSVVGYSAVAPLLPQIMVVDAVATQQGVYLIGFDTNNNYYIVKIHQNMSLAWYMNLTGLGLSFLSDVDSMLYVNESDGSIYLAGTLNGDAAVIKVYQNGTIAWAKTIDLGRTESVFDIGATTDAVYVFGEASTSSSSDAFIARISVDGTVEWVYLIDSQLYDQAVSVIANNNVLYLVWNDGTPSIQSTSGTIERLVLIAKMYTNGTIEWARSLKLYEGGAISALYIDALYIVGVLKGLTTPIATDRDVFIAKVDSAGNMLWLTVYNDTVDTFVVDAEDNGTNIMVSGYHSHGDPFSDNILYAIYDLNGQLLEYREIGNSSTAELVYGLSSIDGTALIPGSFSVVGGVTGFILWGANWSSASNPKLGIKIQNIDLAQNVVQTTYSEQDLIYGSVNVTTTTPAPVISGLSVPITVNTTLPGYDFLVTPIQFSVTTAQENINTPTLLVTVNGTVNRFYPTTTYIYGYSWGSVLTIKDKLALYAPSDITEYTMNETTVQVTLPAPAVVSIAAPAGSIAKIIKDGVAICSTPAECEALRDADGVIAVDPTTLTIVLTGTVAQAGRAQALGGTAIPFPAHALLALIATLTALALLLRRRR